MAGALLGLSEGSVPFPDSILLVDDGLELLGCRCESFAGATTEGARGEALGDLGARLRGLVDAPDFFVLGFGRFPFLFFLFFALLYSIVLGQRAGEESLLVRKRSAGSRGKLRSFSAVVAAIIFSE